MTPTSQIVVGYIIIGACAVFGAMGGLMVKKGYERKETPPSVSQPEKSSQPEPSTTRKEDKQNEGRIVKIKINRVIEDANSWLREKREQNRTEIDKIKADVSRRNVYESGAHIALQIRRVNNFIKAINEYIKEANGKIEDLILGIGEEKFETTAWLTEEYQKYLKFIKTSEDAKNEIKHQNNELCSRLLDEKTFNAILKENPYKE